MLRVCFGSNLSLQLPQKYVSQVDIHQVYGHYYLKTI